MKQVLPTALALCAIVAGGPASALSCLTPSVTESYNLAANSDDNIMIVHGALTHGNPTLPEVDPAAPEELEVPVTLDAMAMTPTGFTQPIKGTIPMVLQCVAGSCATLPAEGDVLAFIVLPDDPQAEEPTLYVDPCGMTLFADPTEAQLQEVVSCQENGCSADE